MAPYPRVPADAFGQARLPRRVKRRIRRQSERAASRIYDPEIEALQAQVQQVRRQGRRAVDSARGAIDFTQNAIEDVSLKGLHGKARRQVAQELAESSKDVAASAPFLITEAKQDTRANVSAVKQDILSTKVEEAQTAARGYNEGLSSARTDAAQYLADKEAARKDRAKEAADKAGNKRERRKELKTAVRTGLNLLATGALNQDKPDQGVPWSKSAIKHYGSEDAAWRFWEQMLADQEGIDPDTAHRAAVAIRKRLMGPLNPNSRSIPGGTPDVRDILGG